MEIESLGESIKKARLEKRLTQAQLAEKLGLTAAAVSMWETGVNMPPLPAYFKLVNILDMKEEKHYASINA